MLVASCSCWPTSWRALRDVEGRKSVILFSEGFEIDNVRRELEDVAGAAAQSYSVVYALEPEPGPPCP